ncbi:MAG TPA: hypothetical protein VF256_00605, partial [Streptosporangiaceae bacterium]
MTIDRLRREAEAHGVATSYRDWRGHRADVSVETLRAVLAAMCQAPPQPGFRPAPDVGGGRGALA